MTDEVGEKEEGDSLKSCGAIRMADTAPKLDAGAQRLLCQALAEYCTYQQAADRLQHERGIELSSLTTVEHYAKSEKWRTIIDELRAEWTARLADVPGANKRTRLQELWRLHEDARRKGARRDALACIEAIRREMEGPDNRIAAAGEIRVFLGQEPALLRVANRHQAEKAQITTPQEWQECPETRENTPIEADSEQKTAVEGESDGQ